MLNKDEMLKLSNNVSFPLYACTRFGAGRLLFAVDYARIPVLYLRTDNVRRAPWK